VEPYLQRWHTVVVVASVQRLRGVSKALATLLGRQVHGAAQSEARCNITHMNARKTLAIHCTHVSTARAGLQASGQRDNTHTKMQRRKRVCTLRSGTILQLKGYETWALRSFGGWVSVNDSDTLWNNADRETVRHSMYVRTGYLLSDELLASACNSVAVSAMTCCLCVAAPLDCTIITTTADSSVCCCLSVRHCSDQRAYNALTQPPYMPCKAERFAHSWHSQSSDFTFYRLVNPP
jgi:hypothetical protein